MKEWWEANEYRGLTAAHMEVRGATVLVTTRG